MFYKKNLQGFGGSHLKGRSSNAISKVVKSDPQLPKCYLKYLD